MRNRKAKNTQAAPTNFGGADQLRLSGVALLTSTEHGQVSVPDLGLVFDEAGLTVSKATGEVVRILPWSSLAGLASESSKAPGGVVLNVTTEYRSHRFVVPASDQATLDRSLASVANRYRGRATQPVSAVPGRSVAPSLPPLSPTADIMSPRADKKAKKARASKKGHGPGGSSVLENAGARRRRTRASTWVLLVIVLLAAVCGGLYYAQKQGVIHFLPKSIVTPSNSASGTQSNSSAAVVVPAQKPIPGLTSSQVVSMAQLQGLSCVPAGSTAENCTRPTRDAFVHIVLAPGGAGVEQVSARFMGSASAASAQSLFQSVASLPYQGAVPAQAATWVSSNLTASARTVIGGARLSVLVLPGQTTLNVTGA